MCISVPQPLALRVLMTSGIIWCDIDPVWLVKSALLSAFQFLAVNKVDVHGLSKIVCHACQEKDKVNAVLAIEVGI